MNKDNVSPRTVRQLSDKYGKGRLVAALALALPILALGSGAAMAYWQDTRFPKAVTRVKVRIAPEESSAESFAVAASLHDRELLGFAAPADRTPSLPAQGPSVRVYLADNSPLPPADSVGASFQRGARYGLIAFTNGNISIATADGAVPIKRLKHSAHLPRHGENAFSQPDMLSAAMPRQAHKEELDEQGLPKRWSGSAGSGQEAPLCALSDEDSSPVRRLLAGVSLPVTGVNYLAQAKKYKEYVTRYAEQYNLKAPLVLAIMHTESNFNPFAVSRSQAVGLMQIVPETAGHEAHRFLTGIQGAPSLETLFVPEQNIRYGTAYLHLLGQRYFGGVTDKASRQLCMIAAYNGGPGAVLRMFDSDQSAAVAKINAMTPEQVYSELTTQMPRAETRRYVELVTGRMQAYSAH